MASDIIPGNALIQSFALYRQRMLETKSFFPLDLWPVSEFSHKERDEPKIISGELRRGW